ncbi:sensor histidine kinase [Roseobacter sp. GAI101]|nr:sensor histidine kinase [Roseobacter sp. GAI101]
MRLNEKRLRDFAEAGSDWLFEFDRELRFSFVSGQLRQVIGIAPEYLLGRSFDDFTKRNRLASEAHLFRENKAKMMAHENWKDFTFTFVRDDGEHRKVRTSGKAFNDENGEFAGYRGNGRDITDQVNMESRLKSLIQIVETSLNEIYMFEADTLKFIHVNFGSRKNMGYSYAEFLELTPIDIKPDMTLDAFNRIVEPLRNGIEQRLIFETVHQRKDGSTYPVEVHLQLVHSGEGLAFVAVIQDITVLHNQTEALSLRDLAIAEVDTGILITDAREDDNPIVYANKAMEQMTGYTMQEMLGQNPRFLQGDDRDQPGLERIRSAIRNSVPARETLRNYRKDGSQLTVEVSISPVRDEKGNVSHFIGAQSDVTDKLHTEERLRQSQKMEAIGQLTGGIAHDFNNLLTVILGNCELLFDRVRGDKYAENLLTEAIGATETGASLTKQLLSFARQSPLQPKVLNLNNLVEDLSDMLIRSLGETIEITKKLASDLGNTLADPSQTKSALLNLVINARDAMPEGGRLTIETKNMVFAEAEATRSYGIEPGKYVRLTVSDNGVGMPANIKSRVMEPFFTTKVQDKGTGLGLSMVHGFAKQSGGHLDICSELGHGTSVNLYLPMTDASEDECAITNDERNTDIGGNRTVLVVEDDARVRKIAVARLEKLAYQVVEAESGQQALDILAKRNDIDVVFTDMIMPSGMTGAELLVQVQDLYPQIMQLITSGYAEDGGIPNAGTLWLRKPYSLAEMSKVFRQLLA